MPLLHNLTEPRCGSKFNTNNVHSFNMARTREFLRKAGAQISKVLHKRKQRRSKQPRASLVQGTSLMNSPYRFPHNTPTRTFVNSPKTRSSTVHKPAQRLYKSSPLARPSADPPEFYPLSESPVGSRVKQLSTPIRTREGVYDLRAIQQRKARLNPSAAKRSTSNTPKTPVVKIDSAVRNYLLAISSSSELLALPKPIQTGVTWV